MPLTRDEILDFHTPLNHSLAKFPKIGKGTNRSLQKLDRLEQELKELRAFLHGETTNRNCVVSILNVLEQRLSHRIRFYLSNSSQRGLDLNILSENWSLNSLTYRQVLRELFGDLRDMVGEEKEDEGSDAEEESDTEDEDEDEESDTEDEEERQHAQQQHRENLEAFHELKGQLDAYSFEVEFSKEDFLHRVVSISELDLLINIRNQGGKSIAPAELWSLVCTFVTGIDKAIRDRKVAHPFETLFSLPFPQRPGEYTQPELPMASKNKRQGGIGSKDLSMILHSLSKEAKSGQMSREFRLLFLLELPHLQQVLQCQPKRKKGRQRSKRRKLNEGQSERI